MVFITAGEFENHFARGYRVNLAFGGFNWGIFHNGTLGRSRSRVSEWGFERCGPIPANLDGRRQPGKMPWTLYPHNR
jgi:hypothetical protein